MCEGGLIREVTQVLRRRVSLSAGGLYAEVTGRE